MESRQAMSVCVPQVCQPHGYFSSWRSRVCVLSPVCLSVYPDSCLPMSQVTRQSSSLPALHRCPVLNFNTPSSRRQLPQKPSVSGNLSTPSCLFDPTTHFPVAADDKHWMPGAVIPNSERLQSHDIPSIVHQHTIYLLRD